MTAFITLLARELRSRWMLLAAALGMGCFIALISLVPNSRGARPEEIRAAAGLAVALAWAALLAIGLGATTLARDLGERRLAFDFRLPASATAIWGARLLGAYLVVLLAGVSVLLPLAPLGVDFSGATGAIDYATSELLFRGAPQDPLRVEAFLVWSPLLVAGLLLLSHLAGMAIFGSRAWSGVDLIAVGLVSAGTLAASLQLRIWWVSLAVWSVASLVGVLLLAALLAASLLQVARGRSERDRSHSAFSLAFLGLALIPSAGALAYARWYVSPEPSELMGWRSWARGLGDQWVALEGQVRRPGELWVRFLVHPSSDWTLRLGPFPFRSETSWPQLSGDGSTLAWLERIDEGDAAVRQLFTLDAQRPDVGPVRSPLAWRSRLGAWSLSSDGERIATLQYSRDYEEARRVVVETVAEGHLIAALLLPDCRGGGALRFQSDDRLLIACAPRGLSLTQERARLYLAFDLVEQRLAPLDPTDPRDWAIEKSDATSVVRSPGGRWLWRDPATGGLVPLLEEAQYGNRALAYY